MRLIMHTVCLLMILLKYFDEKIFSNSIQWVKALKVYCIHNTHIPAMKLGAHACKPNTIDAIKHCFWFVKSNMKSNKMHENKKKNKNILQKCLQSITLVREHWTDIAKMYAKCREPISPTTFYRSPPKCHIIY